MGSFLNEGIDYGRLDCAVLANFSEPSSSSHLLEKKEEILGKKAGVSCLPSASHRGEGVRMVKLVCVGELLRMGDDSIRSFCPVHLVDR